MKILFILLILTGCATEVHGPYNYDYKQDCECYTRYGAKPGYCDARGQR